MGYHWKGKCLRITDPSDVKKIRRTFDVKTRLEVIDLKFLDLSSWPHLLTSSDARMARVSTFIHRSTPSLAQTETGQWYLKLTYAYMSEISVVTLR